MQRLKWSYTKNIRVLHLMRNRFRRSDSPSLLDFAILRTEGLKYQPPLE